MADHEYDVSDTASDADSIAAAQVHAGQLVIEAPPWLEDEPAKYAEEAAKKVDSISPEGSQNELRLISNHLPTFFVAKELFKSLDLLRNHALEHLFAYLGGGARKDIEQMGMSPGYTMESIKSSWTTVRAVAHRTIGWYSLLLNNKDAENYWGLLATARKVYLSWGLFDAVWTTEEEQSLIFLRLRNLYGDIGNKVYTLEPNDAFGNLDRHGFVG